MIAPLSVARIAEALGIKPLSVAGAEVVTGIAIDSREVTEGDLFFALPGIGAC